MALRADGTPEPIGKNDEPKEITDLREAAVDQQERGLWGEEALQINGALFDHDPTDLETIVRLGRCIHNAGRPCDAVGFFDKVLAGDPGDPVAQELRSAAASDCGLETRIRSLDEEGGLEAVREAADAAGGSMADLHFSVLAHQFIVAREKSPETVGRLARAVHEKGDLSAAETIFRESLDLDPAPEANADSLIAYAGLLREQSRSAEALAICEQVLAARADDVEVLRLAAEISCDLAESDRDHQRIVDANGYADRIWAQGIQDPWVAALYERMKVIYAAL